MSERDWITGFLSDIGAPQTQTNIDWMRAWIAQESPWGTALYGNPLNIENSGIGYDPANTVAWLEKQGYYGPIIAGLKSGNPASYPGVAQALSYWCGGGGKPGYCEGGYNSGYAALTNTGGKAGATPTGSQNTAPSLGGWQNLPQDILQGFEGIAGGILGGIESFLQPLFGGMVSPFLRLPQSLINIGWNFGSFCIGMLLIFISGWFLVAAIFEEGFSTMSDKSDDMIAAVKTFAPKAAEAAVIE